MADPTRRCHIHIGHAKTATTYLQYCMHLNAPLLARHGYWVPADFSTLGFADLRMVAEQRGIMSGNLAPMHALLSEGGEALAPAMEALLFSDPHMPAGSDVVLSSELFFYYWACTLQVARAALRVGLKPRIIVYLARQDLAAIAAYLQNVRCHGFSEGVIDFLLNSGVPYCQYYGILRRMRDKMPELEIECRTFENRYLASGDIWADFLDALGGGVDPGMCTRPDGRSNEGLLLEQYELLRAASILGARDAAARLGLPRAGLTALDRARTAARYYTPAVQAFLTERYLGDNHLLVEHFMPRAGESERSYWRHFERPQAGSGVDGALMQQIWTEALETNPRTSAPGTGAMRSTGAPPAQNGL